MYYQSRYSYSCDPLSPFPSYSFHFKTKTKAPVSPCKSPSFVLQVHSYLGFAFLVVSSAMASNSKLITFEGEPQLQHPNPNRLVWQPGSFECMLAPLDFCWSPGTECVHDYFDGFPLLRNAFFLLVRRLADDHAPGNQNTKVSSMPTSSGPRATTQRYVVLR